MGWFTWSISETINQVYASVKENIYIVSMRFVIGSFNLSVKRVFSRRLALVAAGKGRSGPAIGKVPPVLWQSSLVENHNVYSRQPEGSWYSPVVGLLRLRQGSTRSLRTGESPHEGGDRYAPPPFKGVLDPEDGYGRCLQTQTQHCRFHTNKCQKVELGAVSLLIVKSFYCPLVTI